ncbi:hypothetical protein L596_029972 [Steinernema carpocapsae]|uniref:Uncharacterized protein n=1 Tax=Steinernema carpocapsae TaxID=34508 RepID=A0A4U5LRC6_STECR|nr:hypothetical protein L596_029972 [Steinernema carpocapsae]
MGALIIMSRTVVFLLTTLKMCLRGLMTWTKLTSWQCLTIRAPENNLHVEIISIGPIKSAQHLTVPRLCSSKATATKANVNKQS